MQFFLSLSIAILFRLCIARSHCIFVCAHFIKIDRNTKQQHIIIAMMIIITVITFYNNNNDKQLFDDGEQ